MHGGWMDVQADDGQSYTWVNDGSVSTWVETQRDDR